MKFSRLFLFFAFIILSSISKSVAEERMDIPELLDKLSSISQEHILDYWGTLTEDQQKHLAAQIEALDIDLFRQQQAMLNSSRVLRKEVLAPLQEYYSSGNKQDQIDGRKLIAEGLCGCLVIAGGQGTRLRFDGPKGMFPVSQIKQKTLFQLFAEKTLAAGKQANRKLPLTIMTSPINHEQTVQYFEEHGYFGLNPDQVFFFSQSMLPLLDDTGNLFLEDIDSIALGPDGNGSSLKSFVDSGIWDRWRAKGIKYITYVLVDNPLADPFDAELIGFHARMGCDATIKSTKKLTPDEKVGALIIKDGKIQVVEYSELPDQERNARNADGTLKHGCASLSLFCFSMDYIKIAAYKINDKMPLHPAYKAVKYLDAQGISRQADKPMAWKFEKFIFDVLPFTQNVKVMDYPREVCFAPLKNFSGPESPETVRAALQNLDRQTIARITGIEPPMIPFELSQEFYYPTMELLQKWYGTPLPKQSYIMP